jgi:hypothetical protein
LTAKTTKTAYKRVKKRLSVWILYRIVL